MATVSSIIIMKSYLVGALMFFVSYIFVKFRTRRDFKAGKLFDGCKIVVFSFSSLFFNLAVPVDLQDHGVHVGSEGQGRRS